MPEEFDPYLQWLGIPAHERPIDHYRLLGIARYTSDVALITAAADRQMALLRSYQTGPRGRYTQKLLNELAAAKLCLFNPAAKAAYDAMLEGLSSATETPPLVANIPNVEPAPAPVPAATPAPAPAPPVFPVESASRQASVEIVIDDSQDVDSASSVSLGGIVVTGSLVVIAVVLTLVTWQVILTRQKSPGGDSSSASQDSQQDDGNASDGSTTGSSRVPILILQETDGSVNFTPSMAVLSGSSLRMETVGATDLLTGWGSAEAEAIWRFKVIKLPLNGAFKVLFRYRASKEVGEGRITIAINDREKSCKVRGTGAFVTDEHILSVTQTGEQTLQIRSAELPNGTLEVIGIRLLMLNQPIDDAG